MSDTPVDLDDGAALREFVAEHEEALVEFYTAGCAVCQSMEPVLGGVARTADVAVATVNPGDDLDLVEEYVVRSVPTLLLFVDGDAVARLDDGFHGVEEVREFVERRGR
ncbi:MAG: thioredoxin family protein [Halobacteriaceae archaeon]